MKQPVFLLLLISIAVSTGCQSRPFLMQGVMRMCGNMNMNGDMLMRGDMNMNGDMKMTGDMNMAMKADNTASRLSFVQVSGHDSSAGRVAVLDMDGLIVNRAASGLGSTGENPVALFREKLNAIAADASIAAVVLRINSPGGGVTATDMMSHEIAKLKAARQIPIVTCVMEVGAGGAYYLATQTDAIVAHPTSVVGGIGVIFNVFNTEDAPLGAISLRIKSGDMIDVTSPDRAMEAEELEMIEGIAKTFHQQYIDQVKSSRPRLDDDVEYFDGRVFTGSQAMKNGLVDQTGYLDDAIATARQLAGLSADSPIVMLRRDNDRAYTVLDVSPNDLMQPALIPLNIPGLDRSSLPLFLYLWQPDPSLGAAT